ncbi:hypothetical protein ILUMI_03876 [Ignelater luminosus]|uniref:Uncharacterized protein n=1 Tax=Ignelater luminosus TaxID=2038154 RepID=A0A8K0GLR0_IGNLU|nr:hypothetical protein ILUMI_03876 [Ignelater luminosus]
MWVFCGDTESLLAIGVTDGAEYKGQLKKLVRCLNNPLQQVCRRLSEITTLETRINLSDDIFTSQGLKLVHNLGPIPKGLRNIELEQFKKIVSHNFVLTIHSYSNCDAYCFVKGSFVVQIHNILKNIQTDIRIVGKRYTRHEPLFNYPFESCQLDTYLAYNLHEDYECWSFSNIIFKCISFPHGQK